MRHRGEEGTFRYRVVERGEDYVAIKTTGAFPDRNTRLRFVEGGSAYWLETPLGGLEEKFDKVIAAPGASPNAAPPHR
ncbi:MAG TPA: hypothetical protein P5525_18935 [Candidatus Paceibacterota bacterium]|nr:hypothetical protein [Candidatus Paceibacterota bacterium]